VKAQATRVRREFNVRVGARLRQYRIKANISQGAVAKEIGCSESVVSRYETGAVPCDAETLVRIAAVFGCEPGEFINRITAK
jgi:transcriptional regulator with XRE-family HTH domain